MDIDQMTLVMHYNRKSYFETQQEYARFIKKVVQITAENDSKIIKILNCDIQDIKHMRLNDIVDTIQSMCSDVKDVYAFSKATLYFIDAEKYRVIGEENTHKYLKRRCIEQFLKIKDKELIQKFKDEMGSYLPKNYSSD